MPDANRETTKWLERKTLVYRGLSMYPTFRELDVLSYRNDLLLRTGDVIAFRSPDSASITVHRIVGSSDEGYVTQGDNSLSPDTDTVSPDYVLGRIGAFNRQGIVWTVRGGRSGMAYAVGCHLFRRLRPRIARIAGPVYRRLVTR